MKNFNEKLAILITKNVGTMYCAYLFAVIGITAIVAAITNNAFVVLVVGSVSGYFLQLVLLPVIMVGQNIQSKKHDDTIKHIKKIHDHLGIDK